MCGGDSIFDRVKRITDEQNAQAERERAAAATNPLNSPNPDPYDKGAVDVRLRQKQLLQQAAGYRGTFLTGPRGPGGPTGADQAGQLAVGDGSPDHPPDPPPPWGDPNVPGGGAGDPLPVDPGGDPWGKYRPGGGGKRLEPGGLGEYVPPGPPPEMRQMKPPKRNSTSKQPWYMP